MHLSLSRPRPLPAQGPAGEPGKPGAPGKPGTPGADVSRRTRTHGATRWWGRGRGEGETWRCAGWWGCGLRESTLRQGCGPELGLVVLAWRGGSRFCKGSCEGGESSRPPGESTLRSENPHGFPAPAPNPPLLARRLNSQPHFRHRGAGGRRTLLGSAGALVRLRSQSPLILPFHRHFLV